MSKISDKDFSEFIKRRAREEFTELPAAARDPYAEELINVGRPDIERILQEYVDALGILSLSSKPDSALMWSYYANSHKGMCLGFDTSDKMFQSAHAVRYQRKAPEYRLDGPPLANAEAFVLTKALKWKHEEEWRIIMQLGRQSYPFRPDALLSVIFGASTSDKDRDKVKQWIANGPCHPRLYMAVLRKGSYALKILPIP